MKNFLLALFLVIAFSASAFAQAEGKISLIVKYSPKTKDINVSEAVIKFDFLKGKFVSKKILFTVDNDKEGWIQGLFQNRYIRTTNYTIYEWRPQDEKTFDLQTGKFVENKVERVSREPIPLWIEIKSPDGKKTIVIGSNIGSLDKLLIRIDGRQDLIINESFNVTVAESSSILPFLPILWLDNERILTQKENGKLVVVTLDGKVSPFLEIPCSRNDFPLFRKTKAGKLLYVCNGEYRIDVENKRFEKSRRDLDYDFSEEYINKESTYFFNNVEIGRGGLDESTVEGYLAVTYGKRGNYGFFNAEHIDTIKVWNQFTREWTTLKIDGGFAEILGWYKQ